MKLIIDIPEEVKETFDKADNINFCFYDYNSVIGKAIRNGTPLEFGNLSVEAIEESSHCPACVHYVQRDVPNPFCEKCKNRDELYGRIEKGVLEQIAEEQKTLLDTTKAWSKALEHGDIN